MRPELPVPDLDALLARSGGRVGELLSRSATLDDARYLHWDKLRHLTPPEGLTTTEWWLALKLRRRLGAVHFKTLRARDGEALAVSRHARVEAALARIDRGLAGAIGVPAPDIDVALREQFVASSLMEEAIHSSLFEGAVSTREIAKEMLRSKRAPINRDERMIVNNYLAMASLREFAREPLTVETILTLHRILTDSTLDDAAKAGRIQQPGEPRVRVVDHRMHRVVHEPPPADELPARLDRLVAFANADDIDDGQYVHPVLRSVLLHFQLAYDHPFHDGNGRTARALFYWSMLRRGYWLAEFLSISRLLYRNRRPYEEAYQHTETDEQDGTYFVLQQLDVLCRAVDELHAYVARKTEALRAVRHVLHDRSDVNHRQLALLDHAMRHADAAYTHESHATTHRVTIVTARADLLDLVARRWLRRERVGKRQTYRPVPDLAARLAGPPVRASSRTAAGSPRRTRRR